MSNWKVIYDNNSGKITTDEPTNESCWNFWHSTPTIKGYGSISSTRELCLKRILHAYDTEIKRQEKELKKLKRFIEKVRRELK